MSEVGGVDGGSVMEVGGARMPYIGQGIDVGAGTDGISATGRLGGLVIKVGGLEFLIRAFFWAILLASIEDKMEMRSSASSSSGGSEKRIEVAGVARESSWGLG